MMIKFRIWLQNSKVLTNLYSQRRLGIGYSFNVT